MRNPMSRSLSRAVVLPAESTAELSREPTRLLEAVVVAMGDHASNAVAAVVAAVSAKQISRSVAARLIERLVPSRDQMPMMDLPESLETASDLRKALKTLYGLRRQGMISDAEWASRRAAVSDTWRLMKEAIAHVAVGQ